MSKKYIPIRLEFDDRPTGRNREYYKLFSCCNTENCQAYKLGKCIMCSGLWGTPCPYGRREKFEGYTRQAKQFGELIKEAKEKYGHLAYKLEPLNGFAIIGDYIYTGLLHLKDTRNPIRYNSFFYIDGMICKTDLTPEFAVELIQYKPMSFSGKVLSDYQKEMIPEFIRNLRNHLPELFEAVKLICPEVETLETGMNYIGKKAFVKTLKPCTVRINSSVGSLATWDGKVLTLTGGYVLGGFTDNETITITPTDKTCVYVVENESVTAVTIFNK